jgi:catechol 2,3-dioxygenase-like lactoylglutathione lyase family enzyme
MRVVEIIPDLHVEDIARAREFYAEYLGLSTEEFNMGWVARYTSITAIGSQPPDRHSRRCRTGRPRRLREGRRRRRCI